MVRETLGQEIVGLAEGLAHLGRVIGGVLQLRPEAFRDVSGTGPWGVTGLWIALLAGFSQAIGHAFILFVNRVRPLRFLLSLVVEALLFAMGFLAWAVTTWLVTRLVFGVPVPLVAMVRVLGVAHAPQLLGFLGALPYLGVPWLTLLSLWTALAFVVGLVAMTGLQPWSAFAALVIGWLVMHGLQRSAGRPVMWLGRWLLDRAAGVPVVSGGRSLQDLLAAGPPGQDAARRR
jgi:hypothetical protein